MASRFVLGAGTPLQGLLDEGFPSVTESRRSRATQYPTESGIELTDNVSVAPWRLQVQGLVSAADEQGLSIRPRAVWNLLAQMQDDKQRLMYADPMRTYTGLVIVNLEKTADEQSGLGLMVAITLQQILEASVGAALAPALSAQARYTRAGSALKFRIPATNVVAQNAGDFFPDTYFTRGQTAQIDRGLLARTAAGGRQGFAAPSLPRKAPEPFRSAGSEERPFADPFSFTPAGT